MSTTAAVENRATEPYALVWVHDTGLGFPMYAGQVMVDGRPAALGLPVRLGVFTVEGRKALSAKLRADLETLKSSSASTPDRKVTATVDGMDVLSCGHSWPATGVGHMRHGRRYRGCTACRFVVNGKAR